MDNLVTLILIGVVIFLFLSWAIFLIFKFASNYKKRKSGEYKLNLKKVIDKNSKRVAVYPITKANDNPNLNNDEINNKQELGVKTNDLILNTSKILNLNNTCENKQKVDAFFDEIVEEIKNEKHRTHDYFDVLTIMNEYIDSNKELFTDSKSVHFVKKELEEIKRLKQFLKNEKKRLIEEFENGDLKKYKEKAMDIMIQAMEKNAEKIATEKTVFSIKLEDDSIKGRIIGKNGRNKKIFENITGTNILIDPKDPLVSISSPNPIRREIAKQLLEKLINSKNIEPNRIEKAYSEIAKNFDKDLFEIGKNAIEVTLGLDNIDKGIYPYVGRLNFRTSYGQNNLNHCIECASLAADIAEQLGLDKTLAKKTAFFHDIGKSLDFEMENDHVESGVQLAKKYNLDKYVINAIESHHEKVPVANIYSAIVKVVDSLSAARPGARMISAEDYFSRIQEIENICKSFDFVKDCYALKSGKQVRIIVDPEDVSDDDIKELSYDIKAKLEQNDIVNKQPIEIIVIRESTFSLKTSGSAKRDINNKNE